jgi:hypothetical protein
MRGSLSRYFVGLFLRLSVTVALLALAGCYSTVPIQPSQLVWLDGYEGGQPKPNTPDLLTTDNQKISVQAGQQLFLDLPNGTAGGWFDSIAVRDGIFSGVTTQGVQLQAPIASVRAARVREVNPGSIALAVLGIVAVGAVGALFVLQGSQSHVTVGRALRLRGRTVAAPCIDTDGWDIGRSVSEPAPLSAAARRALTRLWTESARGEHASVPAFSRLSLSLVALGAPARLLEAALRAALEEIEHARLSFSLASAYAGVPVGPGALLQLRAASAVTASSHVQLAAESLLDGCLLEGVAAEVARQALTRARDPEVRAALAIIARDEASHVELAWEIVRWCCDRGGGRVRRRLASALAKAPASFSYPRLPRALEDELADHGWLGAAAWEDAARRTRATVAARVAGLLS